MDENGDVPGLNLFIRLIDNIMYLDTISQREEGVFEAWEWRRGDGPEFLLGCEYSAVRTRLLRIREAVRARERKDLPIASSLFSSSLMLLLRVKAPSRSAAIHTIAPKLAKPKARAKPRQASVLSIAASVWRSSCQFEKVLRRTCVSSL